jgi:hypothetical protein
VLYSIVSCRAVRFDNGVLPWLLCRVAVAALSAPNCAIPRAPRCFCRVVSSRLVSSRLVSCRPFALMTCGCLRRQSRRPRQSPRQTRLLRSFNSGLRGRRDSGTRQHARQSRARLLVEVALPVCVLPTLGTICTVGMLLPCVPVGDADVCGCNGRAS